MSVFHHGHIYLAWLSWKADNLSTSNYPYRGENIHMSNLTQSSRAEFPTSCFPTGMLKPDPTAGTISMILLVGTCRQLTIHRHLNLHIYLPTGSFHFNSLHLPRIIQKCFCTTGLWSFLCSLRSVFPRERNTMHNCRQHVWGHTKQLWDENDPGLAPGSLSWPCACQAFRCLTCMWNSPLS